MAEITEEFDVQSSNQWAYKDFIEKLRRQLGKRSSHNRPTLPIQEDPPTKWFDIILRTTKNEIKLRFQVGNLYLDGYEMKKPKQWLKFNNSNSQLIPGTNFLGFNGDYASLEKAAKQDLEEINLGQQPLIAAVNQLAEEMDSKNRAKSLIVVIQTICESIRFIPISEYLTKEFYNSVQIPLWMQKLERCWGNLSDALLRADARPEESFTLPPNVLQLPPIPYNILGILPGPPSERRITTLADAVDVLGILLGNIYYPIPASRRH